MAPVNDGRICAATRLTNGGPGQNFLVEFQGQPRPAFVVRYRNRVYAYVNQCAHKGVELDWNPGVFFDTTGRYLMCATHGACYEPDTGLCARGPCRGAGLVKLGVIENNSEIKLAPSTSARLLAGQRASS